ncbi:MAG: hypothetical protein Unbinned6437contig1000_3 [Prokaryotic dsDNA virus sp.]|nr:MAG: hypothetical protein Unbinned6437contig1000_3 [Prokaryotic dsDNA virus sp.]|tara:strand:+ start:42082 stop:43275 length:1194 start_codon:yes stop_codon:yes gene_type:complete
MIITDALRKSCTEKQLQAMQALINCNGNVTKAAKSINLHRSTLRKQIRLVNAKLSNIDPSIENIVNIIKQNPNINGVSDMQVNEHGKPIWIKYGKREVESIKLVSDLADELKKDLPRHVPTNKPSHTNSDLLAQYTITDYHLGMLADAEETGGKWNIKLAEQMLLDWFIATMDKTPDTEQAVLMQIGDFLHWDGLKAVTPAHGHVLDADSRYQKLVRACIRVTRQIINMLLEKHGKVHCIFAEGNHDESGSAWMREFLTVFYEDEKRVTVDTSIDPYYAFKFGKVGIFAHHSHKKRFEALPQVFAGKFREIMFACEYCYGHTGHYQHRKQLETNLMIMTQHQTLSAPDAHASSGGWLSKRGAVVIIYHREFGYMTEHSITPAMLGYKDAPKHIYTLG